MNGPDLRALGGLCPVCSTSSTHGDRVLVHDEADGSRRYGGSFSSCYCGALTYSHSTGRTNLTGEVCEAYGVSRLDPDRVAVAVPPLRRRRE